MDIQVVFEDASFISFGSYDTIKVSIEAPTLFKGAGGSEPSEEFKKDKAMYPQVIQTIQV